MLHSKATKESTEDQLCPMGQRQGVWRTKGHSCDRVVKGRPDLRLAFSVSRGETRLGSLSGHSVLGLPSLTPQHDPEEGSLLLTAVEPQQMRDEASAPLRMLSQFMTL